MSNLYRCDNRTKYFLFDGGARTKIVTKIQIGDVLMKLGTSEEGMNYVIDLTQMKIGFIKSKIFHNEKNFKLIKKRKS